MHRFYRVSNKLLVLGALFIALLGSLPTIAQTIVIPAPGPGYAFCAGGNFAPLGNIQITENVVNSYPVTGGLTYFRLRLPAGFVFNNAITPTVTAVGANDFSILPSFVGYFNANTEIEISYQVGAIVQNDIISIANLAVGSTGVGSGNIIRVVSTGPEADQPGNNVGDNQSHGSLTSTNFSVTLASSDADNEVCAGQLVSFTATPTIATGSKTYEFFKNGLSVQGPGSFAQYTTALNDNDEITVTAVYVPNGCTSVISTGSGITTNVLPLPVVNAPAGPFTICGNSFADLAGTTFSNSSGIAWASSGDGSFQPNAVTANAKYYPGPNDIINGSAVLTITTTGSLCTAATDNVTVNVNPLPAPVITGPIAVCTGQVGVAYSTPGVGTHTYSWSISGGAITSSSTASSITVTWGSVGTGTLQVTETITATGCVVTTSFYNVTKTDIVATLTSSDADNVICAGASVTFTATPLGAATYNFRVNGSGVQSGVSNIYTTTALTTGQNVDVIVTLGTGCSATSSAITTTVNANPAPVLASSDLDNTICAGNPVTFTATPAGQTNYEFFVNGTSVQSGAGNTYLTSSLLNGQGVRVVITNSSLCTATSTTINTTVNPNPVATLTSSDADNVICAGASVTFTATPLGAATYNFRVNGSGVQSGVSNIYTTTVLTTGQNVDVIVTLGTGCSATSSAITTTVNANPAPVLASSDLDNTICAGNPVTFTATPAGQTNYEFFVNGTSVQSGAGNTYLTSSLLNGQGVRVVITNSSLCTATSTTINTTVNPNPVATLTSSDADNVICAGASVTFTATPLGAATYNFRVNGSGVQSGVSNIYTTTALTTGQNVDVIVTLGTGCSATSSAITTTVNANPAPVLASSDLDNTICAGNPVTFTATPAGQTNYEFFVNGTSVQSGAGNTYLTSSLLNGQGVRVVITNSSLCTATSTTINTTVNPNPVATLTSSDADNVICAGASVTFTATPLGAATYNFRVNGSGVQSGVSNIYTTTALTTGQNVDVIVTLGTGCSATSSAITTTVNANPAPVLASSDLDNTICAGNPVTFTATPAGQTNYEFFVNGTSVQSGAGNTYLTSSLLNGQGVRVVITNSSLCTATSTTINTTVNPNPVATLTSSDADNVICAGASVTFTATPLGAATYNFRVNGSGVQSGVSNIYTTTALTTGQNVDVIVTLGTGCSATSSAITTTVNANPAPVLASSDLDNTICAGNPVTFTATPAGQTNYEFFVNGTSVQSGAGNTYLTSSLLNGQGVRVVITNSSLCTATSTTINTTVNPNPVATLTSSDADNVICAGASVTFTATPLGAATYNFRVNGSGVQSGVSNIYTTTALTTGQNVDVIVTLGTGCSATSSAITTTVNANPAPVLASSDLDNTICAGNPVTFTATPAGQTNYEFFVNGTSVQSGAGNTYLTSSLLNGQGVRVVITNSSLCTATSTTINTTVNPNPVATLTSSDADNVICAGASVTFTATPLGAATYNFRVNGSGVQSGVSNIYTTTALTTGQNVDVIVTLGTGCSATSSAITTTVNANPAPVLASSDLDNTICAGNPVTFTATPAGQTNYEFFVNGTSVQSGAGNTYLTSSLLNGQGVRVVITNSSLCTATSTTINTTVNPNPVATLTSSDADNVICAGASVTFTATPLGAATYNFRVNGSGVQSGVSNIYTTTALTTGQNVDVIVTLGTGCSATSSAITTTVNANPAPVLASSDLDNTICAGNPVTFTATPAGQTNYEFFVNGTSVQSGAGNTYLTSSLLNGQGVRVVITNSSLCTATSTTINTTVNPNPVVTLTSSDADNVICAGASVTFTATPLGAATYNFRVNGSGVQSGVSNIYTTTALTTGQNVDVIVTLGTGCSATSSAITTTVNANPAPVLASSDLDNTICAGNPVTFTATPAGQTNYEFFVNGTSVQSGAGNTYLTSSLLNGQGVRVVITNSSLCTATSTTINTTVNPNPVATLTSSDADNVICAGASVTFTATPLGAATYNFRVNGSGVQSGVSNIYTTTALTTGQNVDVIVTLGTGCSATSSAITTTVNANPTPIITGTPTVCGNQAGVTYQVTAVAGVTYNWIVNGGIVTSGAGTAIITVTWGAGSFGTVQMTQTITATGCATTTANYNVTINPNPVVTSISNQIGCNTATIAAINLSASTGGGETFNWSGGASVGLPDGSDNSSPFAIPSFTAVNTGTSPVVVPISVTATKSGCLGPIQNFTVTVNPTPALSITNGTSLPICEGTPANIMLTSTTPGAAITLISTAYSGATGGSYTGGEIFISGQKINETLGNPTESPITVTYTFSVSANGCTNPATQSTQIIIKPAPPVFSITNIPSSICTGGLTNITLNSPTLNAVIRLDAVTYGSATGSLLPIGTTYTNGQVLAQTLTNATNAPTAVTYTFSVSASGCNNPVQQQTTVIVNPSPAMSIVNTSASICSNTATHITLNSVTSGAIIRLISVNYNGVTGTLTAPQNYTPGSIITESLLNPTNNPILVTYNFDVSANGCSNAGPFTTTVTVKPSPNFSITNLTPQVCEGSATDITLNTPTLNGQVRLDAVNYNGAIGTILPGAIFMNGQKITEVLVNPTNLPITVTYTFSVSATACSNPVQQQTTVSITRKPTVFAGADTTVCQLLTMPLKGKIGVSASVALWSIVPGAGDGNLSASNVSGTTVTANYAVNNNDVGNTITLRLTTNDPDGPGPCAAQFDDINIKINRAASITAGIDLAQCRDQASIALQGAITYAPNGVSWTGGAGSFGTITSPTSTYNFNSGEIGTNVTLTLKANDPDGSGLTGPCGIVTDQMILKINQLPTVFFSGLPGAIAENATPSPTLVGNQSGGIFTILPATSSIGSTTHTPVDRAEFDPSAVELGLNYVTYTFTDANGCTDSQEQQVIVNPVTEVDFTLQYWDGTGGTFVPPNGTGGYNFCSNVGSIRIVGDPVTGSGGVPTDFKAIGPDSIILNAKITTIGTDYFIDTNGLAPGDYTLRYTYTNADDVTSSFSRAIRVFASPIAAINNLTNNCIASGIVFRDASSLPPSNPFPNDTSTWSYVWNFGDGQFGNNKNQPHTYSSSGLYHVQLQVTTGDPQGCTGLSSLDIRVGDVPIVDFGWAAICTNDSTKFEDKTNLGISTIDFLSWNFGDAYPTISGPPAGIIPPGTHDGRTSGTYQKPQHNYLNDPGPKNVVLNVETNDGCSSFKLKTISILVAGSTVTPDALNPYSNNFEIDNSEWIPEAFEIAPDEFSETSWKFGVPTGVVIKTTAPANVTTSSWWTGTNSNSYFPSEESAVNGPCFDLRSLSRPMIALDYWSDAEQNLDGATLQYSTDGGLNWFLVGPIPSSPNEGINWYKGQTVQSAPGGQTFGWTGKLTAWKNGRFNLDMIPKAERDQVRLRVAFSSNSTNDPSKTFDGFAFDNVFIGERKRNVMVEYFTNSGINASVNTYFDNLYDAQFVGLQAKDSSDFFKIQYHVANPSVDPINQDNPVDPAARSLFYGISQPPSAIMDGILGDYYGTTFNGNYLSITEEELERRSLEDPLFDIKIDTLTATSSSIKFHIEFTYKHPTLAFSSPVTLHAVLLQDNVGTQQNKNVVRKFLLGTEGVTLNIPWITNQMESIDGDIEIDAPIGDDNDSLYLVAFIQDKRFDSKVIHQALRIKLHKKSRAVITGTDDPILAQVKDIAIYPNPATRFVNFATETALTRDYQYTIVDQRGITVLSGNLNRDLTIPQQVELSNIADGVYIVMIHQGNRRLIQRKLAVLKQ